MFETRIVDKIKTYISYSVTYFENRVVYEITSKNIAQPGRPQVTIWCMFIAYWIPKATNTLRICNTFCFPTATMDGRTRLNVTIYVHSLSCHKPVLLVALDVYKNAHKTRHVSFHLQFEQSVSCCPHADQILPMLSKPL